jgi:cytochrome c5
MNLKQWIAGLVLAASVSGLAVAGQKNDAPSTAQDKAATSGKQPAQQDEGQRVFQQHCSRCHTAPEGFSPRISGTIVRHMRVRASISQHDEQELLHFFNP